jgi:putative SOS response-associated peptidase YedK
VCGRYALAGPRPGEWSESRLRTRFPGLGASVELRRRFNVAPTDEWSAHGPDGQPLRTCSIATTAASDAMRALERYAAKAGAR